MNLERIMGSRKDTMTLTMECNRSEKYEKSGSRLQYFVPRHFIEQTSMRKKEVSKKKTLLQYLQPFLAFCMLQRPYLLSFIKGLD